MLRFVARELGGTRILIIATYRDTEVRRSPALAKLTGELGREGKELPLAGLSEAEVARFVAEHSRESATPELISMLHRATAGNPFFLDGIVRLLGARPGPDLRGQRTFRDLRIPDGVREAIRRRLATFSEEANNILSIAAVVGQEFDADCLQRVSEEDADSLLDFLDEAQRDGIIIAADDTSARWRFSHGLIRETLYEDLPTRRRLKLHRRIAQVLEEINAGNPEPHLAELAYHYRKAARLGETAKAIDYSIRAGEAGLTVFVYEEAAEHWQAALELMPKRAEDRERRADLLERLGELLGMSASEGAEQVHHLEEAVKLYQDLGRVEAAARVHSRLAGWHMTRNNADIAPALEHNSKAQDYLTEAPERFSSLLLHLGVAATALEQLELDKALAVSRRAMDLSEQLGDQVHWARAACSYASALCFSGRLAEAFALLSRAWTRSDQLGEGLAAVGTTIAGCGSLISLLDPAQAATWVERELAKPRSSRASFLQKALFEYLGISQVLMGKLAEADSLVAKSQGGPFTEGHHLEGQFAFYQGEWQRAELIFTQALNHELQAHRSLRYCRWIQLAARVIRAQGRQLEAESILEKALAVSRKGRHLVIEMQVRPEMALICVDAGRPEQAHPHLARCREIIEAGEDWRGIVGNIVRAEAAVAAAEGHFEDAEPLFANAVEISRRYQVPFEEAETLRHYGRALVAAGDYGRANEKLDAAGEIYQHHGAGERWLKRVKADRPSEQSINPTAGFGSSGTRSAEPNGRSRRVGEAEEPEDTRPHGVFRKEAEYWTLACGGPELRLKDTRGLHFIAHLLRHPGVEFKAIDLAQIAGPKGAGRVDMALPATDEWGKQSRWDLGDAGPMLDAKAKAEYRRRLHELGEELEESGRLNDLGR
jgi:tetratricopeptide (TPR) repeat protein